MKRLTPSEEKSRDLSERLIAVAGGDIEQTAREIEMEISEVKKILSRGKRVAGPLAMARVERYLGRMEE